MKFGVFLMYFLILHDALAGPPPQAPPKELDYTMQSRIPLEFFYVDDTGPHHLGSHYKYSQSFIEALINTSQQLHAKLSAALTRGISREQLVAVHSKQDWLQIATLNYENHVRG